MPQFSLDHFKQILKENPDLKPKLSVDLITDKTRFREELGFDSLAMAAFFYTLQDLYPELNEESVPQWKKIGDCLEAVREMT